MDVRSIIDCMDNPVDNPGMFPIGDKDGFPASVTLSSKSCLLPAAADARAARLAAFNPKLPKPACPRGKGKGDGKPPRRGFDCVVGGVGLFGIKGVVPVLNGGNGDSKAFLGGVL